MWWQLSTEVHWELEELLSNTFSVRALKDGSDWENFLGRERKLEKTMATQDRRWRSWADQQKLTITVHSLWHRQAYDSVENWPFYSPRNSLWKVFYWPILEMKWEPWVGWLTGPEPLNNQDSMQRIRPHSLCSVHQVLSNLDLGQTRHAGKQQRSNFRRNTKILDI